MCMELGAAWVKVLLENYKAISEEMLSTYLNQDVWAFIFACVMYP